MDDLGAKSIDAIKENPQLLDAIIGTTSKAALVL
jgi:hypothetical protein